MAFEEYCVSETRQDQNPEQSALALQGEVTAWWNRLNGFAEADHEHHRAYGLAVGRVQSGKTRHYIGLILKALDAGYNTIIVLTSSNTTLAHQTMDRVYQRLANNGAEFHPLSTYRADPAPHIDFCGNAGVFFPNAKYVGVVLKSGAGHLASLRAWVDNRRRAGQLANRRILVIDDESDSATPNGMAGHQDNQYQDNQRTVINQYISELFGRNSQYAYGQVAYVGYTATPYACMYNENGGHNQLFPDCIRSMPVANQYFGLERLFGVDVEFEECRMDVVRNVTHEELDCWIDPIKDRENLAGEDGMMNLVRTMDNGAREVEWASLKNAIQWAFCTAAARRVYRLNNCERNQGNQDALNKLNERQHRWTTMLFNISTRTEVHRIQADLVKRFLGAAFRDDASREAFIDSCMACWRAETATFTAVDFRRACEGYGVIDDYPHEVQVRDQLTNWFCAAEENGSARYQVLEINNAHNEAMGEYENDQLDGDRLWIICGGNVLARGLTLEGLTVSYFDRLGGETPIDTVTQMGRWFGYRQGYELLPRIWMDANSVREIKRIAVIEAQMHDSILAIQNNEGSLRDEDIPAVQYFGRRLSGRDAAGGVQRGVGSYGVFSEVGRDTYQLAFEATRNFLYNQDGTTRYEAVPRVQNELPFQRRHSKYFGGVASNEVSAYLEGMRDFFSAGSLMRINALLARLHQGVDPTWEVVVGAPDTDDQQNIGAFGMVNCRSRTGEDLPDGAIRLSHMEFTRTALLARKQIPDDLRLPAHNFTMGDVNRVFEELAPEERHPILLIDFVRDRATERVYVQPTFYWHGFAVGDYFGLMIGDGEHENPGQPQNHNGWNLRYGGRLIAENIAKFPRLVASVVRRYIEENPNADIDALENQFHGNVWAPTRKFFVFDPLNNQEIRDADVYRRLRDVDGENVVVGGHVVYAYNQWRRENKERFLDLVRGLGFAVE